MMYHLNKVAWALLNPEAITILGLASGIWLLHKRWRRLGCGLLIAAGIWLWLWTTPFMSRVLGVSLEDQYLSPQTGRMALVDEAPSADAIVVLGGGIGGNTNVSDYAVMWPSANRVWHATRLWKAGKAPIVIVSATTNECCGTQALLADLGLPEESVVCDNLARNTEENAKCVQALLMNRAKNENGDIAPARKPRILLVTSAWHMKRSALMFQKYAPELEVIPVACEFTHVMIFKHGFSLKELLPSASSFSGNEILAHEWVGWLYYRFLR